MSITTTASRTAIGSTPAPFGQLMECMSAWLGATSANAAPFTTGASASDLYARAARYESTQPGFAADLRAAAEAMDRAHA
jgi:hypothetical protein